MTWKGHEGNFRGDRHVLYTDCGGGYTGAYVCHSSSRSALEIDYLSVCNLPSTKLSKLNFKKLTHFASHAP